MNPYSFFPWPYFITTFFVQNLHYSHLQEKEQLFANIAAAAESGWDFSSRWMDTASSAFATIRTETIVPVDMNAILCAQERIIGEFYDLTGMFPAAEQ